MPDKLQITALSLYYAGVQALRDISLTIPANRITALIGPSGCGKSTLLRTLNRMAELDPTVRWSGKILLDGEDIAGKGVALPLLRKKVGMVFQKPVVFPISIYENVSFGPRMQGVRSRAALDEIVETSLRRTALWPEVRDRLKKPAGQLSGGQQQRLCIARALAAEPEILLLDEPTSALDPASSAMVEALMDSLRAEYTLVLVTHSMQQAARISDQTAFFLSGELIEAGPTGQIFSMPKDMRTEKYITGQFG